MNSASENFVLNEENMVEIKSVLLRNGRTLEKMVDDYNRLLAQIRFSAVLEGKTAKNLDSLITNAKVLNNHIQSLTTRYAALCDSLVDEVDRRDRYLY